MQTETERQQQQHLSLIISRTTSRREKKREALTKNIHRSVLCVHDPSRMKPTVKLELKKTAPILSGCEHGRPHHADLIPSRTTILVNYYTTSDQYAQTGQCIRLSSFSPPRGRSPVLEPAESKIARHRPAAPTCVPGVHFSSFIWIIPKLYTLVDKRRGAMQTHARICQLYRFNNFELELENKSARLRNTNIAKQSPLPCMCLWFTTPTGY
ncbi:unnamed protein product [Ectocarpus fasciculatus]